MATTLATFVSNIQLGNTSPAVSAIATSSSTEKKMIATAVFTNTNTTTEEIEIWLLPSGVAPAAGSYLVKKSLPAGKTWACQELAGQVFESGAAIYGASTTASQVNVYISGVIET